MVLLYNGVKAFAGSLILGTFEESVVDKFRNTFSFDLFSWAETSWEYLELIPSPPNDYDQQTCLGRLCNILETFAAVEELGSSKSFQMTFRSLAQHIPSNGLGWGTGIGGQIIFSTRSKLNRFTLLVCWVGQHTLLTPPNWQLQSNLRDPKHLLLSR